MSVPAILRQRRDTASNWTAANPTPQAGQLCFETDTLRAKLGNGSTAWASLAYLPSGVTDGDKGDVTVSGTGATWTIDAGVVTLAKMANIATNRLIGRATAGTGVPEAITCTAAGRAILDDADAEAQRATLGLGSIATAAYEDFSLAGAIPDAGLTCKGLRILGNTDAEDGPIQEISVGDGLILDGTGLSAVPVTSDARSRIWMLT